MKPKRLADAVEQLAKLRIAGVICACDNHMMDRSFIAEYRLRQGLRIAQVRDDLVRVPESGAVCSTRS
jgi:hypothetical protein